MGSEPDGGVLDLHGEVAALIAKAEYTDEDRDQIRTALTALDLLKSDTSKYVELRQIRGKLIRRSGGELSVVASGRQDWVGWLELRDTGAVLTVAVSEIRRRSGVRPAPSTISLGPSQQQDICMFPGRQSPKQQALRQRLTQP